MLIYSTAGEESWNANGYEEAVIEEGTRQAEHHIE